MTSSYKLALVALTGLLLLQTGCSGAVFEGASEEENASRDDFSSVESDPVVQTPPSMATPPPASVIQPPPANSAPLTGCAARSCVADSRRLACESSNKCTISSCGRYSFVVPAGTTQLLIKAWAGGGGSGSAGVGGGGSFASSQIPVTPGETLNVLVAQGGCENGGGAGGSFIVRGSSSILLAAGGGGGGGSDGSNGMQASDVTSAGAPGGGLASGGGTAGYPWTSIYGSGAGGASATSTSAGSGGPILSYGTSPDTLNTTAGTAGSSRQGGIGGGRSIVNQTPASWELAGQGATNGSGGGGGAGYFGGGGGAGRYTYYGAGGGGGSSFATGGNALLVGGTSQMPGHIIDPDYGQAAGLGGYRKPLANFPGQYQGDMGNDGRIVISW